MLKTRGKIILVASLALLLTTAFLLNHRLKKKGAASPPPPGTMSEVPEGELQALLEKTRDLDGFLAWSSNRFGNHEILLLSLPDRRIRRLTNNPHVDYYPRISPDGSTVAFSRSQAQWQSQRDYINWDVYITEIESGEERLIARNANTPTWSEDGRQIFFQREGQFVEYDLESNRERVLFHSGKGPVPGGVLLLRPSYSRLSEQMAATLRGKKRMTALFSLDGSFKKIGGGCQVAWSYDESYLYYVDRGGRKENLVYRYDPGTGKSARWLDLPGEFSHEYFPRQSNDGEYLVLGASASGHEHDTADYEIFLWKIGSPPESVQRLTYHTGNDCWPDLYLRR